MALFMLDTDSVSFALRGHGKVGAELMKHRRSELCVSAITGAELRFGADKRASRKIHRAIEIFLAGLSICPFDEAAATRFGVVAAELVRQGTLIGQMDTLIAAHALSVGATLVTNNQKHFSKVLGLKIENWT